MTKNHVCPQDGRSFATAKALAQHKATHKVADKLPKSNSKTSARSRKRSSGVVPRVVTGGGSGFRPVITTGTDLLIQATVSGARAAGSLIFQRALIPNKMQNTRISAEAVIWQRWRPRRLVVKTVGSGPTTAGGSFVLAWSPDPHVNKEGMVDFISMAISAEKNAVVRFDQTSSFTIPCETTQRWYNVDGTVETSSHGTLFAVLITPPNGIKGTITMPCMLDWEIQWEGRKLDAGLHKASVLKPDDGYHGIFTTSDSGYDSTILTFKMHSGGSMVPFTNAVPGAIYTTNKGTSVHYYMEDGRLGSAQYFSRVISYEVPGLVLHASLDDARDYQRTAQKSYCLHYKQAGPLVTPDNPEFTVVNVQLADRDAEIADLRRQISELKLMLAPRTYPSLDSGSPSIARITEPETELGREADQDFEFLGV